jgi:hypothetical protein
MNGRAGGVESLQWLEPSMLRRTELRADIECAGLRADEQ